MINSSFLDICSSLLLNNKVKAVDVSRNILEILTFYEEQTEDIPLLFRDKFELVKLLSLKRLEGLDIECCVDDIVSLGKFVEFKDYVKEKSRSELSEDILSSYIERLRSRKKLISIFKNRDRLESFLHILDEESFEGIDNLVTKYEQLVKSMFIDLVEESRAGSIESVSVLDFESGDYTSILDQISNSYDPRNSVSTGYYELDSIMNGGFEPTRVYILAAPSNVGKTNFLINFALNAALQPSKEKKAFLFITLENLVHENLVRMYCKLFKKKIHETIQDVRNGTDIVQHIRERLDEANSKLVMKYYPAHTISPVDIMIDLDEVQEQYQAPVRALYVDYLDLLRSDISSKENLYRIELGFITLSLKTLAIKYNIPTVTASQLNRGAYNSFEEVGVDNMGESIKKVEHSDWVGLLSEDPSNDFIKHLKIGKNRSGPKGFRLTFNVDFQYYDVIGVRETSQSQSNQEELMRMAEHPLADGVTQNATVTSRGTHLSPKSIEEIF